MSEEKETTQENQEEVTSQEESTETPELKLNSIFGFKKGMTAIFNDSGERVPVTVLECKPWVVTQIKSAESDGYEAIQVSYGRNKDKNSNKASNGHSKKAGATTGFKFSREIRESIPEGLSLGQALSINSVSEGTKVKVTASSKGRGFSGAMKRHGFGGGPASHGSGFHRRPGSIGNCTFPGRVMPGKKMPGQYGAKNITVKGIKVVSVIPEENVVLLYGSVPGALNALVKVTVEG